MTLSFGKGIFNKRQPPLVNMEVVENSPIFLKVEGKRKAEQEILGAFAHD